MPKLRNPIRVDPTRTSLIRRQFQADIRRRIGLLLSELWDFLVLQDALGLAVRPKLSFLASEPPLALLDDEGMTSLLTGITGNVQPREFAFQTDPQKLKSFNKWLQQQIDAKVFSVLPESPDKPWTMKYIQSAYKRGIINAYIAARKKEAINDEGFFAKSQEQFLKSSFNTAETISKVEFLATRTLEDLRGVTNSMATKMNRILAQGMIDGSSPRTIARTISQEVAKLTKSRALTIARTEVIAAHAEAQLDTFEKLGVDELGIVAEWHTVGDERVCPECSANEGKTFTIDEARGMIPMHSNCRCNWSMSEKPKKKKK